jgi:hypothetical protein
MGQQHRTRTPVRLTSYMAGAALVTMVGILSLLFDVATTETSAAASATSPVGGAPSPQLSPRSASTGALTGTVGIAAAPGGQGYWVAARSLGLCDADSSGDAEAVTGSMPPDEGGSGAPVAITSDPAGQGYWIADAFGGVCTAGAAKFFGSTTSLHLVQPIVGMAATPDGAGYWLVAADGGIFTFGDAGYFGSTGAIHLNQPIVGMAATPDGHGYWLVAADGGIFTFGDAGYYGSAAGWVALSGGTAVGMAPTADAMGYWVVTTTGDVFDFGDAPPRRQSQASQLRSSVSQARRT